jgi:DNA adenine methylase
MGTESKAAPFIKATGGKGHCVWRLLELMPATIATYYEPFVGGGALFWALAQAGRFRSAVLADANEELIRTWLAIQRNHVGVLRELARHRHSKSHYLRVRAQRTGKMTDEARGARYIFLNKAGFNGMWRVNAAGEMNIPYGDNAKMEIFVSPARLKACAQVLNDRKVTIVCADFADVTRKARLGDAIVWDPPYFPVSKTASFTSYTKGGFVLEDQQRLAAEFARIDRAGVSALACNANVDLARQLYDGAAVESIMAARSINSDTAKRGKVKELFFMTSALAAQVAMSK